MRKLILILIVTLCSSVTSYSQYYVDYGLSLGASNYLGEFGGGEGDGRPFVLDMEFSFTKWNLGGFYRYRVSKLLAVKAAFNYIRLSGDDKKSGSRTRRARNLNFKNDMFELAITGEFYIYKINDIGGSGRYTSDFNLYLFGGVGAFYSDPKGQNLDGDWVRLRPLKSEGVSYGAVNMALPLGIGFYYTLNRKYRIGMDIGWRTTFTDYIDDASGRYANDFDGITNKTGPTILDEVNAENSSEVPLATSDFQEGSRRGNPKNNDSYMIASFNFSIALKGKSKFYKAKHSWVHGNRGRRRSRPKF